MQDIRFPASWETPLITFCRQKTAHPYKSFCVSGVSFVGWKSDDGSEVIFPWHDQKSRPGRLFLGSLAMGIFIASPSSWANKTRALWPKKSYKLARASTQRQTTLSCFWSCSGRPFAGAVGNDCGLGALFASTYATSGRDSSAWKMPLYLHLCLFAGQLFRPPPALSFSLYLRAAASTCQKMMEWKLWAPFFRWLLAEFLFQW